MRTRGALFGLASALLLLVGVTATAWGADIKRVFYSTRDGHIIKADYRKARALAAGGDSRMWDALKQGYLKTLYDANSQIFIQDKDGCIYNWGGNINSEVPRTWPEMEQAMAQEPLNNTSPHPHSDRELKQDGTLAVSAYPLQHGTIECGGVERTYEYYLPSSYDGKTPVPLVLSFHGYQSNGIGQRNLSGLDLLAEKEGFIVVFPNGTEVDPGFSLARRPELLQGYQGKWNIGIPPMTGDVDDVAFVSALIDKLTAKFNIDRTRVYATGMSNGSMFCHKLAIKLSDKIAAIAGVTGPLTAPLVNKTPKRPITVIQCQGDADPVVPFNGNPAFLSAHATVARWVYWNKTGTEPGVYEYPKVVADDPTSVVKYVYGGGTNGTKVIFYHVKNGGHTWPGGPQYLPVQLIGLSSEQISLTEEIWKDLKDIRLPEAAGVEH